VSSSEEYSNPSDDQIREILRRCSKVAVVGLSSDPTRPSHGVARYLKKKGFTIIPVNPNEKEVLGEKAYPDLTSIPEQVEIVDVFRRSKHLPDVVNEAIKVEARVVWMQEGVVDHSAAIEALKNGIVVVMDRCMAKACRALCE
jgi:predicted CoA-binding protein